MTLIVYHSRFPMYIISDEYRLYLQSRKYSPYRTNNKAIRFSHRLQWSDGSRIMNRNILLLWFCTFFFTASVYAGIAHTDKLCGYISVDSAIIAKGILSRPTGLDSVIITAHFAIHYSITTGDSNQTTQVYAESTAAVAEFVRHIEYETLGWRTPLSDGDTLYDIYIRKVVDGNLGRTIPEASGLSNAPCPSYIELRMGQTMSNLRHTLAHELSHASQYSYTHEARASDGGAWFYENTAEWATQYVIGFTDNQFLNRINGFSALVAPYHKITFSNGSYEYGGALWCNFLMEWTGDSLVIRKIWEQMSVSARQQILKDIDTVLFTNYGKKLIEALNQYAIWRSFTGKRADSYHFKYAQRYTALKDTICTSYPFTINRSDITAKPEGPGGCKYFIFKKSGSSLTVTFHGQEGHAWKVYVIAMHIPQPSLIDSLSLTSTSYGAKTFSWGQTDSFAVIPIVLDTAANSSSLTFALSAFDTDAVPVQFTNAIHGANAGGMILMDNTDSVHYGETRMVALGSQHTAKPAQERFTPLGDSIYKHHDWNGSVITLLDSFRVDSALSLTANFRGIVPAQIHVLVAHFPSMTGGVIQFRDPWYLHSDGTQPDSFFSYTDSYVPTGAYNQTKGGVFLNQSVQSNNYYSIRAESTQILGGYACTFDHWDTTNVTLFPISNSAGGNQQAVVFNADHALLSAIYLLGKEAQFIHLDALWNLVSVPAESSDNSVRNLFPGSKSAAYYFDAASQGYKPEDTLKHGIGYWIKYSRDTILPITGTKLLIDTINVTAGWNIIGSLSDTISVSCVDPLGTTIQSQFFGYKEGYIASDMIIPGRGYWVKVSNDGQLVLKSCASGFTKR